MGRNIYLSVLGSSIYKECSYVKDDEGFESIKTLFVQQATLEYWNVKSWNPESSRIFIAVTEGKGGSFESNWKDDITERYNSFTKENIPYRGLQSAIRNMGIPDSMVEAVRIPDGKDEDEIWKLFDIIYDKLEDGDILYVDMTHSFRYLPMLIIVLCNYAKFLKNVEIQGLSYGNYEARKDNKAPLIDLLPIVKLQQWTFASADFVKNGNASELQKLCKDITNTLYKGRDVSPDIRNKTGLINKIVTQIEKQIELIQLCQGKEIINSPFIKYVENNINKINTNTIKPLKPILEKAFESLHGFNPDEDICNMIEAAVWSLDRGMYQQSITFLEEGIITYLCEKHDVDKFDLDMRECINIFVRKSIQKKKNEEAYNYFEEDEDERKIVFERKLFGDQSLNINFVNNYNMLIELRNYINHAGMKKKCIKNSNLKENIKFCVDYFNSFIKDDPLPVKNKESLLINLSNHPFDLWDTKQQEESKKYGACTDIAFPDVDPAEDEIYIANLVEKYLNIILKYNDKYKVTVHVMGEMCFCFNLINRLKDMGIESIASCSGRDVKIQDNEKVVTFHFDHFRKY